MPKMYEISIPFTGNNWVEVIAETEEEAIDLACERAADEGPDYDNAEFDHYDAEVQEVRDLTDGEMGAWLAEKQAELDEANKAAAQEPKP